jgi:magnesium transporter
MKRSARPTRRTLYRSRNVKAGLPPESLVYVGDRAEGKVRMTLLDYTEDSFSERTMVAPAECAPFRDSKSVTWVNVDGLSNPQILESLGKIMGFHSLVLEDILNTDQRAKFEDYGSYIFLVAKMLEFDPAAGQVHPEHLALVLGPNFLMSFQEIPGDPFEPVRARIRTGAGKTRKLGADYLLYALLDVTIDQYFVVLDKLGDRVEELDQQVLTSQSADIMEEMHALKREILFLRRHIAPLRDVVSALRQTDSVLVKDATVPFFRDLHDHLVQISDRIDTYRDLLSGMLDLYLSSVGHRTTTVMKIIAVFSSIFLPLTFITGLFGMNFEFMPLLHSPSGFLIALISMVSIVVIMLGIFRLQRWV